MKIFTSNLIKGQFLSLALKLKDNFSLFLKVFLIAFLAFFLCPKGINAQTVDWATDCPKFKIGTISNAYGGDTLIVKFTLTSGTITSPKVTVSLPANYSFTKTSAIVGSDNQVSIAANSCSGTSATITLSSLTIGQTVSLSFPVKSICGASSGSASIKILSNTTTKISATAAIIAQNPIVRFIADNTTLSFSSTAETKQFSANLDAINGTTDSCTLILQRDLYTTISNFKINGNPISATKIKSATYSSYIRDTVFFNKTVLIDGKLDATAQTITFDAKASRCNSHTIYSWIKNKCGTQINGSTFLMSYTSIVGTPKFTNTGLQILDAGMNVITNYLCIPKDFTPYYVKATYRNDGTAHAWDVVANMGTYSALYGYIDETSAQYQIDSKGYVGISSSMISSTSTIPSANVKTNYIGKVYRINTAIPDTIPIGSTITLLYKCYSGNVHDYGTSNFVLSTGNKYTFGYYTYVNGYNKCKDAGVASAAQNFEYEPVFRSEPVGATLQPNNSYTESISLYTGGRATTNATPNNTPNITAYNALKFNVKVPNWIKVNKIYVVSPSGGVYNKYISSTKNLSGTDTIYTVTYCNNPSSTGTSSYLPSMDGANLVIEYSTLSCPNNSQNYNSKMRVWMDRLLGTPTSTWIENISQVYKSLTLSCFKDGVYLTGFGVLRDSIGLKDSNQNWLADDVTKAPQAEIKNDVFLADAKDAGHFYWNAVVTGDYSDLYIPVSLNTLNLTNILLDSTNATVSINNTSAQNIEFKRGSSSYFWLHLNKALKAGDILSVKLPFIAKTANDSKFGSVLSECFVSNIGIPSLPLTSTMSGYRHGTDSLSASIAVISSALAFSQNTNNFYNTQKQNNLFLNSEYNFNNSPLLSPYFTKEIRAIWKPMSVEWNFPDGFYFHDSTLIAYNYFTNNLTNSSYNSTTTKVISSPVISGNKYTYDISNLYNYGGSSPSGWTQPDDRFILRSYANVRATRRAPYGATTWISKVKYHNLITNLDTTLSCTNYFYYYGSSITMNLSSTSLSAYSDSLNIPVVTLKNPSTIDVNKVWLYVDGNVKNIYLSEVGTNLPAKAIGSGYQGRWIYVGDKISASTASQYQLNFTYNGKTVCGTTDSIKVYTVCGFDDATWIPTTANIININDYDHVSAPKIVLVDPNIASTITGSLVVSNSNIVFNQPYTLIAKINSKLSQAALRNPQMQIIIPAGQSYVANSAQIEYPVGNKINVSGVMESSLLTLNNTLSVDRSFIFSLKDALGSADDILMAGYSAAYATNNQEAIFTADFAPLCDTKLTGIQYKGVLSGTRACASNPASGSGSTFYTQKLRFANTGTYTFKVVTSLLNGNKAFNQYRRNDTVSVSINKSSRLYDDILATDSILIDMPKCFNLNGTMTFSGAISSAANTSIISNTINGDFRTIKVPVPSSQLNALSVKDGIFKLKFPIVYTPDGQAWANNPVDSIDVNIASGTTFGNCVGKSASLGGNATAVAMLTTDKDKYKACYNSPIALNVSSSDFSGGWYQDSLCTKLIAAGSGMTITPKAKVDSIKYYIKSTFKTTTFGSVPMFVYLYPIIEAKITPSGSEYCYTSSSSVVIADNSTVGGIATSSVNIDNWQWYDGVKLISTDQNLSQSLDPGSHNIILFLQSKDGCFASDTTAISVYKTPNNLTKDNYFCAPGFANLLGESDVDSAVYIWYVDNIKTKVRCVTTKNNPLFYPNLASDSLYFVEALNHVCSSGLSPVRAIAFPKETEWIGTSSNDWNDKNNWTNNIPGICSNVIIKSSASKYPDLSLKSSVSCNKIKFEPGTSIFGLEKLAYDSALVMLDLKRDKWYMLTSPLKEMFSGDYYYEGAPVTQMKLFGYNTSASPGTNIQTVTGGWTNSFASLTEKLTPGEGFAYKIEETEWHYPTGNSDVTTDKIVTFPRTNSNGSLKIAAIPYNGITGKPYPTLTQTMIKDNAKAYRFAMENATNSLTDIVIHVDSGLNLIGNPLMSYLDFNKLYIDNSSIIQNYVQFWNGSYLGFGSINTSGNVSGSIVDGLSLKIPPMKSFVVHAKSAGNLIIKLSDFTPDGSVSLKSASTLENTMYIESDNGLARSSSAIVLNSAATNNSDNMDVVKLCSQIATVPEVYSIVGKKALDINQFKTFPYVVPIGVKSGGVDSVKLNFKGVESFEGVEVKLINTATNETQDLKENCKYCLRTNGQNSEGSLFLEFRSASVVTGISSINNVGTVQIYGSKDNSVKVLSPQDNKALEIFVYDPLGKLIAHKTALKNTCESLTINHPGKVFVVKVISEKGVESKKVILE